MPKRLLFVLLVILLAVTALPGLAAADDDSSDDDDPIYLSLGTSLAAGTLADSTGASIPFSEKSYTDRLHHMLDERLDLDTEHVKLGCPGETTNSMITGEFVLATPGPGTCSDSGPLPLYDTGTQLGDALATLASGNVALVTIDMGANDALRTLEECGLDPVCIQGGLGFSLFNLQTILFSIRSTGYDGPIIGMTYYNPNLAAIVNLAVDTGLLDRFTFAGLTNALTEDYNNNLELVYAAFGAKVADVETAFDTQNFADGDGNFIPDNVDVICELTFMCVDGADPNIHPTPEGYRFMATVFLEQAGMFGFDFDDDSDDDSSD